MPHTKPRAADAAPKLLHIFKPGKWTAMSGESIEFSAADLAAAAQAFDPTVAKAPIVIGHPATDDPAQGWVSALVANAQGLFAKPAQVNPAFADAVRSGSYGTVSAKFYRPTDANNPKPGVWYLRHVGFLGAAAPGVKGLDSPGFAGAEDGVCFQEGMAFSEWDDVTNAGLWRNLREWLLVKFGVDEADKVLPNYDVSALELGAQDEVREAAAEAAVATGAANDGTGAMLPAPQFSDPQPKEPTVTPEEKAALEAENTRLRAELAAHKAAQVHAAHVAFCEGQTGVLPAWREVAVATLDHLVAQSEVVQFGEGEAQKPLAEQLKAMLAALPAPVQFGEHATHARAAGATVDLTDAEAISARAQQVQAQAEAAGQHITHAHAVSQVVRGH